MAEQIIKTMISQPLAVKLSDASLLKVAVRDTSELQEKIDLSRYVDEKKVNPTRLVVVDQFPKPGEQVPKGTPITLTFMSKDSIQVADIADLSDAVKGKYGNAQIKAITDDIQSDVEIKKVLTEKKEYSAMTPTEKDAVKKYVKDKGIVESSAIDAAIAAVHKDLVFIYNI